MTLGKLDQISNTFRVESYLNCLYKGLFFGHAPPSNTKIIKLLICASAKQKQQIIKMKRLWNAFQVSAVELERARVQKNLANEIIEFV